MLTLNLAPLSVSPAQWVGLFLTDLHFVLDSASKSDGVKKRVENQGFQYQEGGKRSESLH